MKLPCILFNLYEHDKKQKKEIKIEHKNARKNKINALE